MRFGVTNATGLRGSGMISLVVNTCALQESMYNTTPAGVPYNTRTYALRNWILPQYIADPYIDEVIVVGSWEEGEGYQYIPSPSKYFSCVDALEQRQLGFEASTGDVVIFQHDDHVLENEQWIDCRGDSSSDLDCPLQYGVDVLSPSRYTRLRFMNGERLNNGEPGYNEHVPPGGHLSGHCAIFRREVIERCPWTDAQKVFTWDVSATQNIVTAGFKIVWTDAIRCWDVEEGSTPWL